jgi:protein O-mannosyl-transferase
MRRAALLFALVVIAYLPTFWAGWIWDDDQYVTGNPMLTSVPGLVRIWSEPGATPQYYPLVFTSFWIERHAWGLRPLGYHVVNVLLHAASALLLWRLLLTLGVPYAWLAAAVWALHPVQVESVAWVTERKNVLSMLLALGSILAYVRAKADGHAWYALALALFIGAMLSKTVTCSVPAVLLLLIWWQRGTVKDMLLLIPFFVVGLGLAAVTIEVEREHVGASGEEWIFTTSERVLIASRAVWFYAEKLVFPHQLTFIYPRWSLYAMQWWPWCFTVAALSIVCSAWLARATIGRGPLVALLIFGGVLTPALGFFDVYPFRYSFVADHFQYHASAALLPLLVVGLGQIVASRIRDAGALILAGLMAATALQTTVYRDSTTLWVDTLAKNPDCWMAWGNLAVVHLQEHRWDAAAECLNESIRLNPHQPESTYNLARLEQQRGRIDEAIRVAEAARLLKRPWADVELLLGDLYRQAGDEVESVSHYRACLEEAPAEYAPRAAVLAALWELE